MSLKDKLLEWKKKSNEYTYNPLIDAIDINLIEKFELEAPLNNFVKKRIQQIINLIKKINIADIEQWRSIFEIYNELKIYFYLSAYLFIEPVKEKEFENTPDFRITFKGKTYFIEVKSLSFFNGNENYLKTMEEGLDARISIENQLKLGRPVASAITEILPYLKFNKQFDMFSTKYVIESLIDKISQNIKSPQFKKGDTILFVDLKMLPLHSNIRESLQPIYFDSSIKNIASGELWNLAFGKIGHQLYRLANIEGTSNIDGELEKEGILNQFDFIKGMCFQTYKHFTKPEIVGLFRRSNTELFESLIEQFCVFFNDDFNSHAFRLK